MPRIDFSPLRPPGHFDGAIAWTYALLTMGGIERQLLSTGRILADRGVEIDFVCNTVDSVKCDAAFLVQARDIFRGIHGIDKIREAGGDIIASALASVPELRSFSPKLRMVTAMYAAAFVLLKNRVVHNWSTDFLLPAIGAVIAGVPRVIISGRSMAQRSRSHQGPEGIPEDTAHFLLSWLLSFPGCSLSCNSEAGCADHADWLGLDPRDVPLTLNAVVPEQWKKPAPDRLRKFREAIGIHENVRVLGGAWQAVRRQRSRTMVHHCQIRSGKKPDTIAVLGGEGYESSELARVIAGHPIGRRFIFPGKITDPAAFYHSCDAFLLTSFYEGLPNVVLEAQCCGVPVVSVDAGGAKEIVESGKTGFIAQSRAYEELGDLILKVLDDGEWARKAGRRGSERVREKYSPHRAAESVLGLYSCTGDENP